MNIPIVPDNFGNFLDNIDEAGGRNAALRDYVAALHDLQNAHDEYATSGNDGGIASAQSAVEKAFVRLMLKQFGLNQ